MSHHSQSAQPFTPPRYTIDLSLPPRQRYQELAVIYKSQIRALTGLFDELLLSLAIPPSWLPTINKVSKIVLRKVHDSEQTQELRGISEVTGVAMYLLVAFNVVLDLLMGCTSGAARSLETDQSPIQAKMLHFRTLDWTMDPLRNVVVQLDFVRGRSFQPDVVLASSITYVGFTGVLTGVRRGLSMSLNFRAVHNAKTRAAHFRFYFHHVLVLLGRRPSIASMLRHYLLADPAKRSGTLPTPATVASDLQARHTTAAYIILSDGRNTLTMEKDYATAVVQQSSSFIAITNHDKQEIPETQHMTPTADISRGSTVRQSTKPGLEELLAESEERLQCIQQKWNKKIERAQRPSTRNKPSRDLGVSVTKKELIKWLCDWPTTNECTHYSAILDATDGEVAWARAYPEPLQEPV